MEFFNKPFVVPSLFLSAALLIGLWIVGAGIADRSSGNVISSTGSASIDVKADDAKWTLSVHESAYEGQTAPAFAQVARDAATVTAYLKNAHLSSTTITATIITADEEYKNSGPTSYNVHEEITIESSDVDGIQKLAQNINTLTEQGLSISPRQPEYYVTNLPAIRVQLMGKAVEDAKARAKQLAESGGSTIGALRSASSGVVQVQAPNSIGGDDYGAYDTSTIQKEVSVTAHVTFSVN